MKKNEENLSREFKNFDALIAMRKLKEKKKKKVEEFFLQKSLFRTKGMHAQI